jgi:hypothetical protein
MPKSEVLNQLMWSALLKRQPYKGCVCAPGHKERAGLGDSGKTYRLGSRRTITRRRRGFLPSSKRSLAAALRVLRSKSTTPSSTKAGFLLSILKSIHPPSNTRTLYLYLGIVHPPFLIDSRRIIATTPEGPEPLMQTAAPGR